LAAFLPSDATVRQLIRTLCSQMEKEFGLAFSPDNDCGESVILLVFD